MSKSLMRWVYMIWVTTLYSDVVMTRIAVHISICIETHCMSLCLCHLVPAKACVSDASPHWEPIQKRLNQISYANRNHIPRPFGWELTNELETSGTHAIDATRSSWSSSLQMPWTKIIFTMITTINIFSLFDRKMVTMCSQVWFI